MVYIFNSVESPITVAEIEKLMDVLERITILYSLKSPIIEYIYIVRYRDISKYCREEEYIQLSDKSCIKYGVIILCGDVLPNIFIEEFMRAFYSLAMIETYNRIFLGVIDKIIKERFLNVLINIEKDV